jgi:hypothetical protein
MSVVNKMSSKKFIKGWSIVLFPSLGIMAAVMFYFFRVQPYPGGDYSEWLWSLIFFGGFQLFWLFASVNYHFGNWYNATHVQ